MSLGIPGPGAPKKLEKDKLETKHVSFRVPVEYLPKIQTLKEHFDVDRSSVFRFGLDRLWSEYEAEPGGAFNGPLEIQEKKAQIVRYYRDHKGEATAARLAGTTSYYVKQWREKDEFFDMMCREARKESIERVDEVVWSNAVMRNNIKACSILLKAKHDRYAGRDKDSLEKEIAIFMATVVYPTLERHISRETLDAVIRELSGNGDGGVTQEAPRLIE